MWQGYLESSTVEPVLEMAGLVQISRAIEANATLMQAQDLLVGQAINTFGKVT
jgi:flagellar basal body rod protein FlgG